MLQGPRFWQLVGHFAIGAGAAHRAERAVSGLEGEGALVRAMQRVDRGVKGRIGHGPAWAQWHIQVDACA